MDIKIKVEKIKKLISQKDSENFELAKNILLTLPEFEQRYIEKKLNRSIVNDIPIATASELHRIATNDEQLELVKEFMMNAINSFIDTSNVKVDLKLKLYEECKSYQVSN